MPKRVPTLREVPQIVGVRWNPAARQYVGPSGRFIPRRQVRGALDEFIKNTTAQMGDLSRSLVGGDISLATWQTEMMALSKETNLAGAALERGGWYQMDSRSFGKVGAKVKGEYRYLENFAIEIESGKQRLDGTLVRRAELYGQQGRVTYYDFARDSAMTDEYDLEESVTTAEESCDECIAEERRGPVKIGTLKPIGDRICLSNCKCYIRFTKSSTGSTRLT